jgi:hypothetical protein
MVRFGLLQAAAASAVVVASAGPALAQDSAAADALFKEGKELVAQGKVAEACPKFQAALELQRQLGTLMNLADCLEQTGKLASAAALWGDAIAFANELKDDRASYATERRDAVLPRVPKLLLDVTVGSEPLRVSIAGAEVKPSKFGLPMDVDPGKLSIEVSRGDEVLERIDAEAREGQTSKVAIDLVAIAKRHPEKKKKKPAGPPPRPEQRIAGYVVLGVGLAGVTAFGVLESVALAKRAEADEEGNCVDAEQTAVCSPQGYELVEEAGLLAEVGQWLGIGGLATVGVGLTLVLTAPTGSEDGDGEPGAPEPKAAVLPWVSPAGAGLVVGGTW